MKNKTDISNDLSVPLKETDIEWILYVYKKKYKTQNGIKKLDSYEMYKINTIDLFPIYSDIHAYILKHYINELDICNYSAEIPKQKIGFIDLNDNNNILKNSLELIDNGKNDAVQFSSKDLSLHGYILECKISGNVYMQIFYSSNPIKVYKNKYSIIFKNKFKEITEPVFTINKVCDCMLFNDYALFFTGRAESIFDLEKHYKALASKCLYDLKSSEVLENIESFIKYASVWPKAAKFETYDENSIKSFSILSKNKKDNILGRFDIQTNEKGAIIADTPDSQERVLKFVCNKYLMDFNNEGYEVAYSQKINPHQ